MRFYRMFEKYESGVSETIGFIIILSIVITGIGIITLYGYPILLEEQQNANIRNMEKNLIVLQNDLKLLTYKSVPYRETSMQISGGTLEVIPPGQSRFEITNESSFSRTFNPGYIQYYSDNNNVIIGLQNGAVVENWFNSGSTMISEPRWYIDTDLSGNRTVVISIINLVADSSISTSSGVGTVQMTVTPSELESIPASTVFVRYYDQDAGYRGAWANYFQNTQVFSGSSFDNTDTKLTIPGVNKLIIKTYNVTVLNL
jgi:hypothetical protein